MAAPTQHKYKLSYFDIIGGRGEPIRLAFHYGGIAFEDERIKFPEWPGRKPQTPFGSIPVLTVDGTKTLTQSNAILHFVGEITGLYPKDAWEGAKVDELLALTESSLDLIVPTLQVQDLERKKQLRQELAAGKLGELLGRVDANLKNNHANPFCTGTQMSVGDIKLAHQVHLITSNYIEHFPADFFDRFPHIIKIHDAVYSHPKIKDFYPPKVASAIWFTAKEGELEKFTEHYANNPFKVITSHPEVSAYTIGQSAGVQGTAVIWNSAADRTKGAERSDVKAAIEAVKTTGLAAHAIFRTVEAVAEFNVAGKSVKANATCVNMFRIKLQEGKLDEFAHAYVKHMVPHLRQFPDHLIKYFGGVDRKENEWVGFAYYASTESLAIVRNEAFTKALSHIEPFTAEKPNTTVFTLKHVWERS